MMSFTFSPPNQLTLLRIVLTPVFLAFLFSSDAVLRQLSLLVFFIALLTDWYDGWVARRWGYVSRWGKFFDPLADKVVTSATLVAFIYLDLVPGWTVWVIIGRDILVTFFRTYSELKGKAFDTSKLAKTKTFMQFIAIFYILFLYVARDIGFFKANYASAIEMLLDYSLLYSLMVVIALFTLWTGIMYIIDNWKTIRELYSFAFRIRESEQ
ncbi:MAG: CDP-diacylglycerol--glycerol-3-phosphate 3-phosphatidyltransferase [Ignavibacteriae bacterium]|nr:CDP-diacylglycerol--glycerol-3-phosphate 3-phosphatidyltransferase [Ignavibacteriota bacterium]